MTKCEECTDFRINVTGFRCNNSKKVVPLVDKSWDECIDELKEGCDL